MVEEVWNAGLNRGKQGVQDLEEGGAGPRQSHREGAAEQETPDWNTTQNDGVQVQSQWKSGRERVLEMKPEYC